MGWKEGVGAREGRGAGGVGRWERTGPGPSWPRRSTGSQRRPESSSLQFHG